MKPNEGDPHKFRGPTIQDSGHSQNGIAKQRKILEAKYVIPNISRKQAAERAENAVFVPGDLDL